MSNYKAFAKYTAKNYVLEEIALAVSEVDFDRHYYVSIHELIETLGMDGHEVFLAFNMAREMSLLDYHGKNFSLYALDAYNAFEKLDPVEVIKDAIERIADDEDCHDSVLYSWYVEYCEKEENL